MSLSRVKMGFKVTQLSGVYHVFLRTRLFLSTHFRSHVSPSRSQCNQTQCNREVHGLEGPRQISQCLTHFTHIMQSTVGGKKLQRVANFPEYFLLSCGLVWLISKYFCLVYTGAPELVSCVTFSFSFMLIPDHLGDKNVTYFFMTYFFLSKRSMQSGMNGCI